MTPRSISIPIKEQCVFVCLFVFFLSATRHLSTLRRCLRVAESRISRRRGRLGASGQAHVQREHARAFRTTSQRKNRCADAFQKQNRTRAHAVVYVKKGKRKPTCHFPSSVYSLPSLGVFTFRIVLNRILHKSSLLGPHGITENQATYLHCGGKARAKKRARPPATCRKASTGKTGADTGPEGCGSPAVFTSPCLGDSSTKTTIMTVHVNKIMQAAPSQRRIISISEASNQLLFHSQKFFVE